MMHTRIPLKETGLLLLVLWLAGCGGQRNTTVTPVPYTSGTGQVIIRLLDAPGNIFPSLRATPTWELYGDGTLLYQSPSGTLLQAQLQPSEISHILDVVVRQDTFFADKKNSYGKAVADVGQRVLTLHADHQQKTVSLYAEKGASSEDQHIFDALHFLQSYQPGSSQPYRSQGVIVLTRPLSNQGMSAQQWPYTDISLKQIALQECKTLYPNSQSSCMSTTDASGYYPIYGKRGTDLLDIFKGQQRLSLLQEYQMYEVMVWPLLPDNLILGEAGKQWVETVGMNGGRWPLLTGSH